MSKLKLPPRQHYASESDYNFFLEVAKESNYWYMPYMMELAYLCRMRLSEVTDFRDSDEQLDGLLIRRRKGSKANIVIWTPKLKSLWNGAKNIRNSILSKRKQPQNISANERTVFISSRTGDKLSASSVKTAKNRLNKTGIMRIDFPCQKGSLLVDYKCLSISAL